MTKSRDRTRVAGSLAI